MAKGVRRGEQVLTEQMRQNEGTTIKLREEKHCKVDKRGRGIEGREERQEERREEVAVFEERMGKMEIRGGMSWEESPWR